MREEDLAAVAALEADAHAAPWTHGNFRDALAAGYSATIGEIGGVIVAYGVMMLAPGEAQLLNLTVADGLRRRSLRRTRLSCPPDTDGSQSATRFRRTTRCARTSPKQSSASTRT